MRPRDKVKGQQGERTGNGFKLFYIGEDGRRNGVGIVHGEIVGSRGH